MKKNLIALTVVFVITCGMALAAPPVYPVLFQGDGTALDRPINGWAEEIVDISGNGNNLIATTPVGTPNDVTSHLYYTDDGPGGAGDAFLAGLAYAWLKDWPLEESVQFALAAADITLSHPATSSPALSLTAVNRAVAAQRAG